MYRLFYDFKTNGDVLFIVFKSEEIPDEIKSNSNVTALYKKGELVGINIFGISEVLKLKSHGIIFTPDNLLIDGINIYLKNAGLEPLAYCKDSGYKVGKIIAMEEHPLDSKANILTIDFGSLGKKETVSRYKNLEVGAYIVGALDGCIKADGTTFKESTIRNIGHQADIMCGKELKIDEEYKLAFIPEGYQAGEDFFLGGK